jgi:hypothetical protein
MSRQVFEFQTAETDTGTITQIGAPFCGAVHSIGWNGDTGTGTIFVQLIPRHADIADADTGAAHIILNRTISNPDIMWMPRLTTTLPAGTDTGHLDRDYFVGAGDQLRVRKVAGSRGRLYVWIKCD